LCFGGGGGIAEHFAVFSGNPLGLGHQPQGREGLGLKVPAELVAQAGSVIE
jgi:hypothetical protein